MSGPHTPTGVARPSRISSGWGCPAQISVATQPSACGVSKATAAVQSDRSWGLMSDALSSRTAAAGSASAPHAAQRVTPLRGQRRGLDALAGDVTDEDHPARVRLDGVKEVAAHEGLLAGGSVERGEREVWDVGQVVGQQAGLQRLRDAGTLRV